MRHVALTFCTAAMAATTVTPVLAGENSRPLTGAASPVQQAGLVQFTVPVARGPQAAPAASGPQGTPDEPAGRGSAAHDGRRRRDDFGRVEAYGLVLAGGALLVVGGLAIRRRRRRRSSDSTPG